MVQAYNYEWLSLTIGQDINYQLVKVNSTLTYAILKGITMLYPLGLTQVNHYYNKGSSP